MTKSSEARFQLVLAVVMTIIFVLTVRRAFQGAEGRKVMAVLYGIVVVFLWVRYVQMRRRAARESAPDSGE